MARRFVDDAYQVEVVAALLQFHHRLWHQQYDVTLLEVVSFQIQFASSRSIGHHEDAPLQETIGLSRLDEMFAIRADTQYHTKVLVDDSQLWGVLNAAEICAAEGEFIQDICHTLSRLYDSLTKLVIKSETAKRKSAKSYNLDKKSKDFNINLSEYELIFASANSKRYDYEATDFIIYHLYFII